MARGCLQFFLPVDNGSSVKFTIKNFGLNVTGSFKGTRGKIVFNPANIAASSFTTSVAAASIKTGNGLKDDHLIKEDYFDVVKFPQLSFASYKISNIVGSLCFGMSIAPLQGRILDQKHHQDSPLRAVKIWYLYFIA